MVSGPFPSPRKAWILRTEYSSAVNFGKRDQVDSGERRTWRVSLPNGTVARIEDMACRTEVDGDSRPTWFVFHLADGSEVARFSVAYASVEEAPEETSRRWFSRGK